MDDLATIDISIVIGMENRAKAIKKEDVSSKMN